MNREDIIRMAREAGFENSEYGLNCTPGMYAYNMEIVERFAALVAAAEREACAKVAETLHETSWPDTIASAIRARGQAAKTCPPCHGDCNQGRACPARGGHA